MFARASFPRQRSLSMWLAVRAILTGLTGFVVAFVLRSTALPKLADEAKGLDRRQPAVIAMLPSLARVLPLVPVPAVVLGIAAVAIRRLRPVLALLAAAASVVAMVAIVGVLVGAMLPLYQMPPELEMIR